MGGVDTMNPIITALTAAMDKLAGYWMYQTSVGVALILAGQALILNAETEEAAVWGGRVMIVAMLGMMAHLVLFVTASFREGKK